MQAAPEKLNQRPDAEIRRLIDLLSALIGGVSGGLTRREGLFESEIFLKGPGVINSGDN